MRNKHAEKQVSDLIVQMKKIRIEQGLTYEKMVDLTGLHRTTISLIENGKRQPTLLSCIKICEALDADLKSLL